MNCLKCFIILLSFAVLVPNQSQPTQEQIDFMLEEAMRVVWEETMRAKNISASVLPHMREELLENLCSSAPNVYFVTHADLSDSLTAAGNTAASIFISTDNQNSWSQNDSVAPVDGLGYENTWGATTVIDNTANVDWYLWGSVDSGSLGLDFGQITVSQSPFNSGNQWPPSSSLYTALLTDSSDDTGSGQDIVDIRASYSNDKLYTSLGLEGSCCNEGSFFGPWNLYVIAIINPDALDNGVAYAYAYGDGGLGQLYPGIWKINGDFSSGVGEIGDYGVLTTNFDYSTAGNNLQASSLLSTITNDSDWGEWPNSYNGVVLVGVTVQATISDINVLDSTNPGLFIMSTQSQTANSAPVLLNPEYIDGIISVTYMDNENNLATTHDVFIDDMGFVMAPNNHTYSEGVVFSADVGTGYGSASFSFSDGAESVYLEVDFGGGGDLCQLSGDVNGDSQVNVLDIVLTTNLILCADCPDSYNVCADMNQDDVVNVLDIVSIVNLILGNRS